MTHNLSSFKIKALTDDQGERWYLFFRANVTDPFLVLPEFDMKALGGIVKYEMDEAAANTEEGAGDEDLRNRNVDGS